ncbi:MAG: helix-turn-helix transcriptional regulator [Bacteroidales bacterium]|nr:helix-turn-helix transcriptional regulator [Bacteroidales bacterium]
MRMRLAIKIADAIAQSGLTQKEFAERMNKKPSEISKWLSGTHNFTIDTLYDISRELGITLIDDRSGAWKMAPIVENSYEQVSMQHFFQTGQSRKRISSKQSIYASLNEKNNMIMNISTIV